jgi:hypothetical protein
MIKSFSLVSMAGLFSLMTANAQENFSPHFSFDAGAGFTTPVGNTGRNLDNGWNALAGAGYQFTPHLGALVEFNYNYMGINSTTLGNLGVPGGDVQMWSVTLDPIVHLTPGHPVDVYLIGGGGIYHRVQEFTAPGVATVTGFNPFFGFFPVNVPTTEILASSSVNKPGVNGGMGFSFGSRWHMKFFAEARYHRMFMGDVHTDVVPVTFGVRW